MPGLVGVVDFKGQGDPGKITKLMAQSINNKPWQKEDIYLSKGFALGRVSLGITNPQPQPIFNEDRSLAILMDGELYDYRSEKEALQAKGHKFNIENDPEFFLHFYEEKGKDYDDDLNGSFVVVLWDFKEKRLTIINDRYGLRPLYYAFKDGRFVFSSEVKAILAADSNREIDLQAVHDFFTLGYLLNNETFFQGIKLLPPASVLTLQRGQIRIKKYWTPRFQEDQDHKPLDYYVEALSALILKAIERHAKGEQRIAIPLSGGLDSRTIAVGLYEKCRDFHTFTFGEKGCWDAKLSQKVVEALGTNHHFYEITPESLISTMAEAVWLTDGMVPCFHILGINAYQDMRNYVEIFLNGMQTFGSIIKPDVWVTKERFFKRHLNPLPYEILKSLLTPDYLLPGRKGISIPLAMLEGEEALINKLDFFNLTQRERRFINYGNVLRRNWAEVRTPFFDNDLIDFVLRVPPGLRKNRYLQLRTFIHMFPWLSHIPLQMAGMPQKTTHSKVLLNLARGRRWLWREYYNTINRLAGRIIKVEPKVALVNFRRWLVQEDKFRNFLLACLKEAETLPCFRSPFIQSLFKRILYKKPVDIELISRIITFQLWYKMFYD